MRANLEISLTEVKLEDLPDCLGCACEALPYSRTAWTVWAESTAEFKTLTGCWELATLWRIEPD